MRQALSRRRLLRTTSVIGTFAIGTGSIGTAFRFTQHTTHVLPHTQPEGPTIFLRGSIIARSHRDVTLQIGPEQNLVRFSENTRIWQNGPTTIERIQVGDTIAIAGVPTAEGEVQAWRVWVNLPDHMLGTRW